MKDSSGTIYKLDDSSRASTFEGKSVKVSGEKLTVTFTATTKKASFTVSKALNAVAKIAKSKTLTFKVSVAVDPGGASTAASVKAKA